jgi:molecular chaperone IbpA
MTNFDLSPFFRSTVGFDRLARLIDATTRGENVPGYPPYNIEKTGEDAYQITMAVAGFGEQDLEIVANGSALTITGKAKQVEDNGRYLYRGIAGRAFERRFELADYVKVVGARLENGLLHVDLKREVPEAMKPRTIRVQTVGNPTVLESKAAA